MTVRSYSIKPTDVDSIVADRFYACTPRSKQYQEGFRRGVEAQIHVNKVRRRKGFSLVDDRWEAAFNNN